MPPVHRDRRKTAGSMSMAATSPCSARWSRSSTALGSRLHQQGQVVGRDLDSFYVCFPGKHDQPAAAPAARARPRPES